jgi:hypothetical protein
MLVWGLGIFLYFACIVKLVHTEYQLVFLAFSFKMMLHTGKKCELILILKKVGLLWPLEPWRFRPSYLALIGPSTSIVCTHSTSRLPFPKLSPF